MPSSPSDLFAQYSEGSRGGRRVEEREWEGESHQPRATWSPQALEETGRTFPWSLWREQRGYRGPVPQNVAPKAEPQ